MRDRLFSYRSHEPPEVPKEESPDPNQGRVLSDAFGNARRSLVAVCAMCLAWSTAQFSFEELAVDAAGVSVDLRNASIPLLLGIALLYLTYRWAFEFATMARHVRRWPLARLDFRVVSVLARFSLLAVSAAALDRSLRSVLAVAGLLLLLAVASVVLITILMVPAMFIRMWVRERAGRISAASASFEALAWAGLVAVVLTVFGTVAMGVASYSYGPLRGAIWGEPPEPVALAIFVLTLVLVFLSHWLVIPAYRNLFAERPDYWTERGEDGKLIVTFRDVEKEPLL